MHKTFLAFFLAAALFFAQPACAQSQIGVVDVSLVLTQSEAAKSIQKQRQELRDQFSAEISKSERELRAEEQQLLEERTKLEPEAYVKKRQA